MPITGFLQLFFDAVLDCIWRMSRSNPRAEGGHDFPVPKIRQYALNKRPGLAHAGFDGVDLAQIIPENAIAVFSLGQDGAAAGIGAVGLKKTPGVHAEMPGNSSNVLIRQVCSAVTPAAISAFPALK
jgi:hypothetical protein